MATGIKINIDVFKAKSSEMKNHSALKQLNLKLKKANFVQS